MVRGIVFLAAAALICFPARLSADDPAPARPTAADLEFFEKQIRPLLAEHCASCHGRDGKTKGGLRLDRRSGWLEGGDSGPAVVPGAPDESLLMEAVRYDGALQMPPGGKLPAAAVELLEQWIRRGAPAPDDAPAGVPAVRPAVDAAAHWAYRPVRRVIPPRVEKDHHPIDAFLRERQQAAGLAAAPRAPASVRLRRLSFDLRGVPPSPEELEAFANDARPDAWERQVDAWLASPQFGERWARRWLDVARFGESLTLRGFVLPDAWRYRDYVIQAFNEDRPFDEFIREQIAGDLIEGGTLLERQRRIVATSYLMFGNTNLEEQDKKQLEMDFVDEQIDVVTKGFLAQTASCARCHDHKFDPIPTRDYYALASIFRSTRAMDHANISVLKLVPLPLPEDRERAYAEQARLVLEIETRLADARKELARAEAESPAGPAVVSAADLPGIVVDDSAAKRVGRWVESQSVKRYIGAGYLHDENAGQGEKSLSFLPDLPESGRYEVRFAYTPGSNRADNVRVTVFSADGEKTIAVDEKQAPPLGGRFVSLGEYRFEKTGQSFVIVSNDGATGHVVADAVQFLPATAADGDSPARPKAGETNPEKVDEAARKTAQRREAVARAEQDLKAARALLPPRPSALSVVEEPLAEPLRICIRGNVHNPGEPVEKGVLGAVAPALSASIPPGTSGRRELADWIADPRNPLTARVFVNRCWHGLFGAGLVRTVDNFGTTGEPPSHPELLDFLADEFVRDGWSVKRLVRRIVTSESYQRASTETEILRRVDPENRLLARANRRRLDAECLRDAMLAASGELDLTMYGPTIPPGTVADYGLAETGTRRSIYLPACRNARPDLFLVFDAADPSVVTGARTVSTVAPQALFLMNHPFVEARAGAAGARLASLARSTSRQHALEAAFRQILGRGPSEREAAAVREWLDAESPADGAPEPLEEDAERWTRVVQALFGTIDFRWLE